MQILPDSKKFKILQLANAVFVPTGYGVQSKGNLYNWNKIYDVRQLAHYGVEGARIDLNGLQIYPILPGDDHGDRAARLIFRNSPWKPDLFITLYDIWMGAYTEATPTGLEPIHPYWIPIAMVDHDPIPEGTLQQAQAAFKIVTPTHFGVEQFKNAGITAEYIPFGADTKVYQPPENKQALKPYVSEKGAPFDIHNQTEITEDSFLIMANGANKDLYRKGFPRMFTAIQIFLEQNPDAKHDTRVYVHSWMRQSRDLPHTAKVLGVQQFCRGTNDYDNLCSVPPQSMAKLYGAADIFMHLSEGGGFEVPILESLACGVPVIGSDFVGMNELIKDHGWGVPMKTRYFDALDSTQGIADEYKAADALEDAYNHPDKRAAFGKAGREFAQGFDFEKVNEKWIGFIEGIRRETMYKPLEQRKICL
jgi:glycosyltransferase involved in cell wall biosynthesis